MSFAPPRTPTATPRKALQTTRPSSRASIRPSSPPKESLNTGLYRPLSRTGLADAARPSSRASQASLDGRRSPTKRASGQVAASSGAGGAGRPSSTTTPRKGHSTASVASNATSRPGSRLGQAGGDGSRTSDASTAVFGSSASLVSDAEDDDVPRRRAGFGSLSGPGAALDEETDDEGGSVVEGKVGGSGSVTEDQALEEESEDETETETEEEEKDGKQQNVVVCLRVRPSKSSSKSQQPEIYSLSPTASTLTLAPSHPTLLKRNGHTSRSDEYEFRFDLLHVAPSPTVELYDGKIKPVVRAALGGFNGTVFAYGQTASGKTHTMMGSDEEPGIIPLAIDELFCFIHKQNTHRTYSLRVSFLEIYNEQLRDLLASPTSATASSTPINLSKPPEIVGSGRVENLTERGVSLPAEVLEVLREGEQRRRVGATDWNERSSRSHCVFVVTIESMSKKGGEARTSKLNLIDLAGSESATGQVERLKEGSFINRSLLTLGTVIAKLTEPNAASAHIPYRDSKLTRLLQPALSGNSRVAVVCTVSPDVEQATETLSTLKFARRAKMVVTKAERGVLMTDQILLKRYAAQVEDLEAKIRAAESGEALREREKAEKRAMEAEKKGKEFEDALASTTAELDRLRAELAKTQSLILTGPSIEATARRVSLSQAHSQSDLPAMLSPSRTFSGSGLRGVGVGGGGRSVSEMSALGLGTPLSLRMRERSARVESAGARLAEEDEAKEKELSLTRDLEAARAELSSLTVSSASTTEELSTLRTQLTQLQRSTSLARLDAEKSATAAEDRKARVRALEAEVAELRERLSQTERERDEAREEVAKLKAELEQLREDAAKTGAEASATAAARDEQLQKKDALLADLEATVESLERRLASQTDAAGGIAAALAKERDLALKQAEETSQRIKEVEDLSALASQTASAAEVQLRKEHAIDLSRLQDDLAREKASVESLTRQVERLEGLEKQRTTWRENQRAGTEALKSRLADLQARTTASASGTPSSSSASSSQLGRSTSSASSTASERSRSSSATAEGAAELHARNAELVARVAEMEREREEVRRRVEEPMNVREKMELVGEKERERRRAEEAEGRAEDWKQKYLALQKLLDQLTASGASATENQPPTRDREGSSTLRKPSPSLRAPLGSSQSPSTGRPPMPHSPQPSYSSSLQWNKPTPPPLPYSPQQQSREERSARKARRETIAKDLARLKGSRVVGERREGWDTPPPGSASPTKASFGMGAAWEGARERKGSWEA
ncbi:hypothetical protein JCM6882_003906 [Rhodosporidiobolus microsporus]